MQLLLLPSRLFSQCYTSRFNWSSLKYISTSRYMRKREIELRPKSYYMRKQPEITPEMRFILVDWLIDVTVEYELRNVGAIIFAPIND